MNFSQSLDWLFYYIFQHGFIREVSRCVSHRHPNGKVSRKAPAIKFWITAVICCANVCGADDERLECQGYGVFCLIDGLWQKLISLLCLKFPAADRFLNWSTLCFWNRRGCFICSLYFTAHFWHKPAFCGPNGQSGQNGLKKVRLSMLSMLSIRSI